MLLPVILKVCDTVAHRRRRQRRTRTVPNYGPPVTVLLLIVPTWLIVPPKPDRVRTVWIPAKPRHIDGVAADRQPLVHGCHRPARRTPPTMPTSRSFDRVLLEITAVWLNVAVEHRDW